MIPAFYIKPATWGAHEAQLSLIREQVFMHEQRVLADLEWDGLDVDASHLLALDSASQAIGCARVLRTGHIGRMAVLPENRGYGVGRVLLDAAIQVCKQQHLTVATLSAQTQAIAFYTRAGFVVTSDIYLDANIPHVDMQLKF